MNFDVNFCIFASGQNCNILSCHCFISTILFTIISVFNFIDAGPDGCHAGERSQIKMAQCLLDIIENKINNKVGFIT